MTNNNMNELQHEPPIKWGAIRHTRETWDKVKIAFLSGVSVKDLARQYGISTDSIYKRSRKDNWVIRKAAAFEVAEKEVDRTTEDMLIAAGLPKQERIRLLVEGATQPVKTVFERVPGSIRDTNPEEPQTLATVEPDYGMRLNYLKEIHALTGDHAPKKQDVTSNGKAIQPGINVENINSIELKAMIINRLQGAPPATEIPYEETR